MNLEAILGKIEASKEIPTIGPVVNEVMRLVADPDADFRAVGRAVEQDPALTARVLKVANSSYYGLRGEVARVERAVGLLGLAEVRNIALSLSVISDFSARFGGETFNWERFWEHSSGCAMISRVFSHTLKLPTAGEEYVAGLLHDVGKILLGHHFPAEFGRALELAADEGLGMAEAERRVFGADHAQLGHWLATRWNFPSTIGAAIAWHHEPERAGDDRLLAAAVHLGDVLANAKNIGFGGGFMAVCLEDDPSWAIVTEAQRELARLDVERFTFHLDREVDAARELLRAARAA
jgi:HD-like signal output (HDOD) protein